MANYKGCTIMMWSNFGPHWTPSWYCSNIIILSMHDLIFYSLTKKLFSEPHSPSPPSTDHIVLYQPLIYATVLQAFKNFVVSKVKLRYGLFLTKTSNLMNETCSGSLYRNHVLDVLSQASGHVMLKCCRRYRWKCSKILCYPLIRIFS